MAQAGRSRLSGGERAVVVVSLVLVAVFAVLLAVRLTGPAVPGPTTAASSGTASSPSPTRTAAPTEEATEAATGEDLSDVSWDFVSPSGNIACAVDDERALCGIANFEYADKIPAAVVEECDGKVGHFLQVTADGASFVCDTSGQDLTIGAAGKPALDYGQEESVDGFTCSSDETGMTCRHDESGYSFAVRRAAYDLA